MIPAWRRGLKRRSPAVYTDRDRRTWGELVDVAARIALDPTTLKTSRLVQLAGRREVMMPPGWQGKDSPFLALQTLARGWPNLSIEHRRDRGPELGALAARCAEILRTPSNDHRREPLRRADIED